MTLLYACVLTVVIETAFLRLCLFRSREELLLAVCANAATNLTLNLLLLFLPGLYRPLPLLLLELAVCVAEYAVYAAWRGRSQKLALLTAAANALSFTIGLLIF